jgi:hypothetical protein
MQPLGEVHDAPRFSVSLWVGTPLVPPGAILPMTTFHRDDRHGVALKGAEPSDNGRVISGRAVPAKFDEAVNHEMQVVCTGLAVDRACALNGFPGNDLR